MALGDQIYVYRELMNLKGVYEHHGIDCGDGTVIHYRKPSEVIERTSFETFSRGNKVYKRYYPNGFSFIPDVVVRRAQTRLGEKKYNLLFNNCEHFATWCKIGFNESKQIKEILPIINNFDPNNLYDPLKDALNDAHPQNAQRLLNEALGEAKGVWDDVQPRYKIALGDMKEWEQVAKIALKQNREDLAREALKRKLSAKKQADSLKTQLDQLAVMTEDILKKLLQTKE